MSGNVRVKLVDTGLRRPSDDHPGDMLIVPSLEGYEGVEPGGLVAPDAVIEVPPEVAGEGPHWSPIPEGHHDPSGFFEYREGEFYDLGYGLLAQVERWELAETPKRTPRPAAPIEKSGE
jgi:hypothetical protein